MTKNPEVICDACLGVEPRSRLVPTESSRAAESIAIAKWIAAVLLVCVPMLLGALIAAPVVYVLDRLRA
jgi:hypothetical protein